LIRQQRTTLALFLAVALIGRVALADAYDPPASYYTAATGTGAALKSQLHTIITTGDASRSYDDLRSDLQITDADPNDPSKLRVVYNNGISITKNTVGSIPGWDGGVTWNREHSWPQSRGVDTTSAPDGTDMFHLFSSKNSDNTARGNLNYGGAFGQQNRGQVSDGGTKYYPGDADAGLIARAEFYMAVRYDGSETNTADLELAAGNPADNGTQLGDLNRLLEWHYATPPDTAYERKRNEIIYDMYQRNRNPFIDHPEFVWSIFVNQTNDSQITISAPTTVNTTTGSSTKTVNLGRVFVGGTVPAAQAFTLNKAGNNGTYFEVTASGEASSSIAGRFHAFRTNQTDSRSISIGLNTSTSTAGLKSGTVIVDNLDITSGGGTGRGAADANDIFNVSLAVLNHPVASFSFNLVQQTKTVDFGIVPLGSGPITSGLSLTNLSANGAPTFAANLDLDGIEGTGNTSAFQVGLATFTGLQQGSFVGFNPLFTPELVGQFSATYTLHLSDEDLPGQQMQSLTLSFVGKAILAGDYNGDGTVDSGDYLVWRRSFGQTGLTAYSGADGDGNTVVDDSDFDVWRTHFGQTASGLASSLSASSIPEPATASLLAIAAVVVCHCLRRMRYLNELSKHGSPLKS
jgi:endonuclease I